MDEVNMTDLILFAETARASDFGHRFLVSKDCPATDLQLAAFLQTISEPITIGLNFIAVRADVLQRLENGTVRNGKEVLVLAGIDTANLKPSQLNTSLNTLLIYLAELGDLVSKQYECNKYSKGDLKIEIPEISQWLEKIASPAVPLADWRYGPLLKNHSNPSLGNETFIGVDLPENPQPVVGIIFLMSALFFTVGGFAGLYLATLPFVKEILFEKPPVDLGIPSSKTPNSKDSEKPNPPNTVQIPTVQNPPEDPLKRCEEFKKQGNYEKGINFINTYINNTKDISMETYAELKDYKNKFENLVNAQNSEDKRSYGVFYNAKTADKITRADQYLSLTKKSNATHVEEWKKWAEDGIDVIIKVNYKKNESLFADTNLKAENSTIKIFRKKDKATEPIKLTSNNNSFVFRTRDSGLKYEDFLSDDFLVDFNVSEDTLISKPTPLIKLKEIKEKTYHRIELKSMKMTVWMDITFSPPEPCLPKPKD